MSEELTKEQTMEAERAVRIADAQAMLDFIKKNPAIPFPKHGVNIYNWYYTAAHKDTFLAGVRALGSFEKKIIDNGEKLQITKSFGESQILFEIPRSIVCRKVKVVKEVEEYECDPLLDQSNEDEIDSLAHAAAPVVS